jgi:hypothetical protein
MGKIERLECGDKKAIEEDFCSYGVQSSLVHSVLLLSLSDPPSFSPLSGHPGGESAPHTQLAEACHVDKVVVVVEILWYTVLCTNYGTPSCGK